MWPLERYSLSIAAKLTLLALCRHTAADGRAYPSESRMASNVKVSETTIRKGLKELTRLGVISCQRNKRGEGWARNSYRVKLKAPEVGQDVTHGGVGGSGGDPRWASTRRQVGHVVMEGGSPRVGERSSERSIERTTDGPRVTHEEKNTNSAAQEPGVVSGEAPLATVRRLTEHLTPPSRVGRGGK